MNEETINPDPDLESTQDLNETAAEATPEEAAADSITLTIENGASLEECAARLALIFPADCLLSAAIDAYRGLGREERVPEAAPVINEIANAMPAIKEGRKRITERKRLLEERDAEEAQQAADREATAAANTEARAAAKAAKEAEQTEG